MVAQVDLLLAHPLEILLVKSILRHPPLALQLRDSLAREALLLLEVSTILLDAFPLQANQLLLALLRHALLLSLFLNLLLMPLLLGALLLSLLLPLLLCALFLQLFLPLLVDSLLLQLRSPFLLCPLLLHLR
jgi:hypothetical protein